MTQAIAWGTPYYEGGTPGSAPFTPGAQGSLVYASLTHDSFTFGPTDAYASATLSVAHMYAPTSGAPEYLVGTYYLHPWNTSVLVRVGDLEGDGLHTFTASDGYGPLPTKLILAVSPTSPPYPSGPGYGAVAWYEEAAEPPASVFWTRFINSKEVIE